MASIILDTLLADIKEAMKAQQKDRLLALRTIHSEIKNLELIEQKELNDANIAQVISKAIKQRNESIEQYKAANRLDLAATEQAQIDIYGKYMPAQLSRQEIEAIVVKAMTDANAQGKQDMGKVMKLVMPQVKGKADGKLVNEVVAAKLG